jgi:hypothetical protein
VNLFDVNNTHRYDIENLPLRTTTFRTWLHCLAKLLCNTKNHSISLPTEISNTGDFKDLVIVAELHIHPEIDRHNNKE